MSVQCKWKFISLFFGPSELYRLVEIKQHKQLEVKEGGREGGGQTLNVQLVVQKIGFLFSYILFSYIKPFTNGGLPSFCLQNVENRNCGFPKSSFFHFERKRRTFSDPTDRVSRASSSCNKTSRTSSVYISIFTPTHTSPRFHYSRQNEPSPLHRLKQSTKKS